MRIDWWTLGLQTVNVLILVWILSRFLFRPVVAVMEERRGAAAKVLDEAEAAKRGAIAAREAAEAEAARLASAGDELLRAVAAEAERERVAALAAARAEVAQLRAAAEAEILGARLADASAASDRAARLAVDIAGKLLKRLPDTARVDGFIDGLAQALASLPAASRDGFGAGETARLTAARSLDEKEMESCHAAFAKALGRPVNFSLSVDPDLVAGLELETPHAVVRNSFRGDLSRIVEELTRHDRVQS
jgi:F-type H+-transporting ATPase subunit b